ncbi:MAG: DMT family transporter [Planctomycetota bacterium]|nr:MAG: DMT family transporter [Planctomycetota bacterium]REK37936.1 MAG: DMT family transporter [Planctomycetota bacterium]
MVSSSGSSIEEAAPPTTASLLLRKRPVGLVSTAMALGCSLLWAGQSVAVKVALGELPPFVVMGLRFVLAGVALGLFAFVMRMSLWIARPWVPWLLGHAVLLGIQTALFTLGTDATTSVKSIVIINSFPFFTALICHHFLPDFPFTWRTIVGLLIAFAGLLAVFAPGIWISGIGNQRGDWLVLAAAVMMGVKITYIKAMLRRVQPIPVVFWTALIAAPLLLGIGWTRSELIDLVWTGRGVAAVAYSGLCVSSLAVVIWTYLLSWHSPNEVTVFRMTTPLLGMALGWLILSEPVSANLIVGAVLIALGVWRVTR